MCHSVSSFLSAAENVARQRRNVMSKKKMEEESRAVTLALESHILFIFSLYCIGKCFKYSKTIIFISWYYCSQLVVGDALGMTSSAAR